MPTACTMAWLPPRASWWPSTMLPAPLPARKSSPRSWQAAAKTGAAAPAVPVKDTIKVADKDGKVVTTPDRATLYAVQTPQCFDRALYLQALEAVSGEKASLVTDDCSLFELAGPARHTDGG